MLRFVGWHGPGRFQRNRLDDLFRKEGLDSIEAMPITNRLMESPLKYDILLSMPRYDGPRYRKRERKVEQGAVYGCRRPYVSFRSSDGPERNIQADVSMNRNPGVSDFLNWSGALNVAGELPVPG